ncbi:MAG: META domain-containing protein [Beijerinckiaceae bacterium]
MKRVMNGMQMKLGLTAATAVLLGLAMPASAQAQSEEKSRQQQIREDSQYVPTKKNDKVFPSSMNWVAVSLNGKPLANGPDRPSFYLDEQLRARGHGGCNSFSVTAFPLRQQKFAVGPIAHTRKSCDKGLTEVERRFFVAFRTATEWDLENGSLVLKGQGGVLKFERGI